MDIGPIEYIVVGFPDNKFNGEIAPELAKLIESRTVRILDLVFVAKDDVGDIVSFEFDQLDELWASPTSRVRSVACSVRRTSPTSAPSWSPVPRLHCSCGRTSGRLPSLQPCSTRAAFCSRAAGSPTSWPSRRSPPSRRAENRASGIDPWPGTDNEIPIAERRTEMLRRRPLMRAAATTAVVAGTATVVSGGVRRHQEAKAAEGQQQALRAAARGGSSGRGPLRGAHQVGSAPRPGDPHRRGVRRGEGQDPGLSSRAGGSQPTPGPNRVRSPGPGPSGQRRSRADPRGVA